MRGVNATNAKRTFAANQDRLHDKRSYSFINIPLIASYPEQGHRAMEALDAGR